jgi:hypothetical protein
MKKFLVLSLSVIFFCACNETDVKNHIHKPGDVYCSYIAKGSGDSTFPVCVYCPLGNAMCGTIKTARVLRKHNWITPNQYDRYHLTPNPNTSGCNACEGVFMWEKE